jgi:hypothetical protein
MRPMAVVEVDVAAERSSRLVDAVIGPQIHLLVFDIAPEALEEHVIAPRALAVHADRNLVLDQDVGEEVTRKLAALVRVEDLRIASASACATVPPWAVMKAGLVRTS